MDDQMNYLGASIFWLYIIAALVLTVLVVQTLYSMAQTRAANRRQRESDILTFSGLAGLSFGTLSFNMLNVLIQSFDACDQENRPKRADSLISAIWRWSLTSTLFRDFGEVLVQSNGRYLWSEAALLVTFAVSVFIGVEGHRRQVPRLWAFFLLSQILPVSFTQNLFYVALLEGPQDASPTTIPFKLRRLVRYLTTAYCSSLLILPTAAGSAWLMPLVLLTRSLLLVPLLFSQVPETASRGDGKGTESAKARAESNFHIAVPAGGCILFQIYVTFTDGVTLVEIRRALFEHPAVSSLGCDLIISLISAATWVIRGRGSSQESRRRQKMS